MGKHDGNHKIALSSEEDRATAPVTYRENLAKLGHVIFELWKQTETHRHTPSAIPLTHTGGQSNDIDLSKTFYLVA